jgi:CheY-like chemotaxis protein
MLSILDMQLARVPNVTMTKIMVVEDDEMSRDIMVRRLQRHGFELHECIDAEESLEAIPSIKPDLLLLDINLPGMSGLELAQELKAHPETRTIPMIAVSADCSHEEIASATSAGFDGYETKPVNLPSLLAKIRMLLEARKTPAN